ncbi:hypothetical protein BDV59DRAFT_142526 [Aspergillus ambiguus]|uniref:uncharacterized protein n=1 Tax=Aspergillus ambiguus TaxID=176160 RepID=UPI003CCCA7F0
MDSPSSVRSSPSKGLNNPFSSPTKALNPLSPERMNQQSMPGSPSHFDDLRSIPRKGGRGLSDVQAKVAFLNNLSRTGSPVSHTPPPPPPQMSSSSSGGSSAALQRAILGREEAESALASVSAELSESQSRERRISERLESLLEELQNAKERQAHERSVFEKEIRKARKEAFRAGSTLVKLQEELRNSKSEAKGLKDELQAEKDAKEQAKQEAFERAYALAGLTEEMEVLKEQLRAAQTNNRSDNLEAEAQAIQTKDAGRLSLAEGDLALLATPRPPKRPAEEPADSPLENAASTSTSKNTPPKKPRLSDIPIEELWELELEQEREDMEKEMNSPEYQIAMLKQCLKCERRALKDAEEMIEHMNWECSIGFCQCRIDETRLKEGIWRKVKGPPADVGMMSSADIMRQNEANHWSRWSRMKPENAVKLIEMEMELGPDPGAPRYYTVAEPKQSEGQHDDDQQQKVANLEEKKTRQLEQPDAGERSMKETPPTTEDHPEKPPKPLEDVPEKRELEDEIEVTEEVEEVDDEEEEPLITFSPATGTFHTIPSPARSPKKHVQNESPIPERQRTVSPAKFENQSPKLALNDVPFQPCEPQPHHSPAAVDVPWDYPLPKYNKPLPTLETREFKVPLRNDAPPHQHGGSVSETPINREEALAQIRARRGRTNTMKRSVSANESTFRSGGMGITPVRVARRIPGVQNAEKSKSEVRSRRDLSAPVRMFHK